MGWLLAAALVPLALAACGAPANAAVGGPAPVEVTEYALVEQSTDNPTHAGFQDRVPPAVSAQRSGWSANAPAADLQESNAALNPAGFHLTANPAPPFSAYALYQGGSLLKGGILHFGPLTFHPNGSDFSLPIETIDGRQWVATRAGLDLLPAYEDAAVGSTLPVSGARLAYAGGLLASEPGALGLVGAAPAYAGDEVFGQQTLAGRPFFFYLKDGLTGLHYNGAPLPFAYDHVVHQATGAAAIFNPGGNDQMVWFYALRDGLWYYVEVTPPAR